MNYSSIISAGANIYQHIGSVQDEVASFPSWIPAETCPTVDQDSDGRDHSTLFLHFSLAVPRPLHLCQDTRRLDTGGVSAVIAHEQPQNNSSHDVQVADDIRINRLTVQACFIILTRLIQSYPLIIKHYPIHRTLHILIETGDLPDYTINFP
jgi:hypothetical protein